MSLGLIGLVVPGLEFGGGVPAVGRFVKDVIQRSRAYQLRLISMSMDSDDSCSVRLRRLTSWTKGVSVREGTWEGVSFSHVGATLGEMEFQRYCPRPALSKVLADCDLIQVVCGSPAWANAVLGLGKPVAMHVATRARLERRERDMSPRSAADWWRKGMTEVTDRMDDRALRRVDAIQVMNPWMLDYARKLNAGRDVDLRYAPPGVNTNLFSPSRLRVLDEDAYILCVARLSDPRKRIGLLLDAYALLPERIRAEVRLVLAGSSGPSDYFWLRAHALGLSQRITYVAMPDTETLIRLYQRASVFALPSDEEGFGVVLLEAMACGIPVISTRSGGPNDIITHGKDGFLVAIDDDLGMSDCMRTLLEDSSINRNMGKCARETIEERYDERIVGTVFEEIWGRLLTRRTIGDQ